MSRFALVACALLACAHAEQKKLTRDPLEAACAFAGGQACRELGWKALHGSPSGSADRAAARFFMEGCETKDAQSCVDLGALYAVGRGVRKDDARACALGLADACGRAGLPVEGEPRQPTEPIAPRAGAADRAPPSAQESAAAIEHAEAYARYFIARDLHERLGVTRAALEAEPPAPEDDFRLVRRLAELRRWTVSDCLPVYVYPNQNAAPANAWVSFGIGADGRTRTVRVARTVSDAAAESHERCIAAAVARWEFPAPRVGGRIWLRIAGTGPRRELPVTESGPPAGSGASDAPAYAMAGYTKPAMADPGCVQKRIRVPRGTPPGNITAKFAVGANGDVSRFEVMGPADASIELARALDEAIASCRFIPGKDPEGSPVPIWVILPVRFR